MKSCIILCGGWSQRMGQDKGLVDFNGKPMLIHILETVTNIFDEIIIILRDSKQLNSYNKIFNNLNMDLTIYTDLISNQGPLGGIYTGLHNVNSDHALIIPCDSPLIKISFIEKIYDFIDDYDAVIPRWSEGCLEPLHAIYHKRINRIIKENLNNEIRDVKSLLIKLNVNYVNTELLDDTGQSFKNFNQPKDLK